MWSSRRLRVYLSIGKLAIPSGQISYRTLLGTPSLFIALDLHPFCVGKLGERLGCIFNWREGHRSLLRAIFPTRLALQARLWRCSARSSVRSIASITAKYNLRLGVAAIE